MHDGSMQQRESDPRTDRPPVRGGWLIASAAALFGALTAPLWIIPAMPDPVTAAAWVVVIGVILNGAGMAIRAGVHGAPRGSFMAWMDGAGKVLSLVGWSSALLFVGFNALRETSPDALRPASAVIIGSASVIGGALLTWGAVLLVLSCLKRSRPTRESGGGNVDAARPDGEPAHAALAGEDSDQAGAGGAGRPRGVAVGEDNDHVRAGGQ